jgi:alkylated DNA repair dioxygenase AlkB
MSSSPALPNRFTYVPEVMTAEEERALIAEIVQLPLAPVVMRGFTAKRRTTHFGHVYGYETWRLTPGPALPAFLAPLRARAAALGAVDSASLSEALVTEYMPGAVIGWHRDAPMFGPVVVGFSLGAACRLRLRRGHGKERDAVERVSVVLELRSGYVLAGAARSEWQHSIPAVDALRYSITFRSVKIRR